MISVEKISIFETGADYLVNPVNCVGVAGAGLAHEFRTRFPEAFAVYKRECDQGNIRPGRGEIVSAYLGAFYIVYFPTKTHWKYPSQLRFIELGLDWMINNIIPGSRVAIPKLGCGLGGLDWETVKPIIINKFENWRGDVILCEYD